MAGGDPGDARVEGIEQRRVPFALRSFEAHGERRAHHEALELRFHDPVRATGTRQAQLVATLRAHPVILGRGCPIVQGVCDDMLTC